MTDNVANKPDSDSDVTDNPRPRRRSRSSNHNIIDSDSDSDSDPTSDYDPNGCGSSASTGHGQPARTPTRPPRNGERSRSATGTTGTPTPSPTVSPPNNSGRALRQGSSYPLHDDRNPVVDIHIEISLGKGDTPEIMYHQARLWGIDRDLPMFFVSQEHGKIKNNRHIHILCKIFMPKTPEAIKALRAELFGWFHDGNPDESQRVPMRGKNGYKLWTQWLKQDQTFLGVLGYLQKDRGRSWSKMDGASWPRNRSVSYKSAPIHSRLAPKMTCIFFPRLTPNMFRDGRVMEMSEQLLFLARRAHSLLALQREGTSFKREKMMETLWRVSRVHFPNIPWLTVLQRCRLVLIVDTNTRFRVGDDFVFDAPNRINAQAMATVLSWESLKDHELATYVRITDVDFVCFRGRGTPAMPDDYSRYIGTPGWNQYSPHAVDYDTITFAQAVQISLDIQSLKSNEFDLDRRDQYSTALMTHSALQERLQSLSSVVEGQSSCFPGQPARQREDNADADDHDSAGDADASAADDDPVDDTTLPSHLSPFDPQFLELVQPWLAQYSERLDRYYFLIIVGRSRTGKSQFALNALGFTSPFVCEGGFCLTDYDHRRHDAIILNDVADIGMTILRYKALFQSNRINTVVGESTTNMYARAVDTYKQPIVITMNKEEDWDFVRAEPWIRANSFVIDCDDQPMYNTALALDQLSDAQREAEASRASLWNRSDALQNDDGTTPVQQSASVEGHDGNAIDDGSSYDDEFDDVPDDLRALVHQQLLRIPRSSEDGNIDDQKHAIVQRLTNEATADGSMVPYAARALFRAADMFVHLRARKQQ